MENGVCGGHIGLELFLFTIHDVAAMRRKAKVLMDSIMNKSKLDQCTSSRESYLVISH